MIVRAEGITELVGDLLLQCMGGNPTPRGQQIPVSNFQLTLNTNVTSRLIGSTGFTDALLLLDEPYPQTANVAIFPPPPQRTNPPTVSVPQNSPNQIICHSNRSPVIGDCNYLKGTFDGPAGLSTAYGSPNNPYLSGAGTIFVARQSSANSVMWLGIPIDGPGAQGVHIIRVTNVRANACQIGLSATLIPTQIVGFIAVTGSQFINVRNAQQTLAYIQQGLVASGQNTGLQQCVNFNANLTNGFGTSTGIPTTNINIREGFEQSFKRRQYSPDPFIADLNYSTLPQNIPGYAYNTESAFEPSQDGRNYLTYSNGIIPGNADFGTRILLRFNNIASGVQIILPTVVALTTSNASCDPAQPVPPSLVLTTGSPCAEVWNGGFLELLGTSDLDGNIVTKSSFLTRVGSFSNDARFFSVPH